MNSPCYDVENKKDCSERHAGCAVNCPKWAAYVEARNAEYARRRAEKDNTLKALEKAKKRYRRYG